MRRWPLYEVKIQSVYGPQSVNVVAGTIASAIDDAVEIDNQRKRERGLDDVITTPKDVIRIEQIDDVFVSSSVLGVLKEGGSSESEDTGEETGPGTGPG